jgi:type VI secretion system secreted protein Hcp
MAIDAYRHIDAIKGKSADHDHTGRIELTSAQWGAIQPKSATASTAGGHTAGRFEHKTLAISKLTDLCSPVLMRQCSSGKTIPKATREFIRADGNGNPVKYYVIELENALIGHMDQVAHEGSGINDAIGLRFSKIKWKYCQQKIAGGNTAGGWDLTTNRIA